MNAEKAVARDQIDAGITLGKGAHERAEVHGRYSMVCRDAEGNVKWAEEFDNLVVNTGKAYLLDKALRGSAYTAAMYLVPIEAVAAATDILAADTLASHSLWNESIAYSNATRVAAGFNAAASAAGGGANSAGTGTCTNSATPAVFNINATATIDGAALIADNSTKNNTASGTLISAGQFSGGSRAVVSGDTLSVTYTMTN